MRSRIEYKKKYEEEKAENALLRNELKTLKENLYNQRYNTEKIKERDNNKCRLCGESGNGIPLQVHHLTPLSLGGNNFQNNLITVCESCHFFLHANPQAIIKRYKKTSTTIKNGLKNARDAGKILGRPMGSKDTITRDKTGYINRWKK